MNDELSEKKIMLEEYKLLNNLITEESHFFWNRFNIIFIVNSFLLTVCAFLMKTYVELDTDSEFLVILKSVLWICIIFGILITFIWFVLTERGRTFKRIWSDLSRHIEEELKINGKQILKTYTTSYQILYEKNPDGITNSYKDKAKKLYKSLRWGQKRSINQWISYVVVCFFLFWLSFIPLLLHIQFSNWKITISFAITLPIIAIILLIIDICLAKRK